MGKHYPIELKQKVIDDYKSGKYGGSPILSKVYGLKQKTTENWIKKDRLQGNQLNDIGHKRGRPKEENIDYKERYEILKNTKPL